MKISGWRPACYALLVLLGAVFVIGSFSRALAWVPLLGLYQNQFRFAPGDWFAARLNQSRLAPQKTCILVGASSVREGFSSAAFERLLPNTKVVNLATTGSAAAIDAIEIQAQVLANLKDRYSCIIVGLHPIFLRKFDPHSYELIASDYVAVLPLSAVFDFTQPFWKIPNLYRVFYKYLMPLGQQSLLLDRLVRSSLYNVHYALVNPQTPRRSFERYDGEFTPPSEYNYFGSVFKEAEQTFGHRSRAAGWDQAASFGGTVEASALRHALQLLSQITATLFVVEMPESYLFEEINLVARVPFESVLTSASAKMTWLQCAVPKDAQNAEFYDDIHLNEIGRERLSTSVAPFLSGNSVEIVFDGTCRIKKQS